MCQINWWMPIYPIVSENAMAFHPRYWSQAVRNGSAEYNYDLSQRRANAVIQYLASKYNVPAHKIYVIGLGKDKPVETNKTAAGRADNRRVDVRLMTNTVGGSTPASGNPSSM